MGKIASKKTIVNGIEFDSKTEAEYYEHLLSRDDVKCIVLQPQYELLSEFNVLCDDCTGTGKQISDKTGKPIQCNKCKGEGTKKRRAWKYTADFDVTYTNDYKETIDVKGHANERFPLVKKMWEYKHNRELVVVKKKGKGWVRV